MNSNRSRRFPVTTVPAAGGLLAVGLGIGAALAAPGVASADPSSDPFSWIGGLDPGALSAAAPALPLDMQVSIDNIDLFPTAGNTATAVSGPLDIAIAIGNASAQAGQTGGLLTIFDFAFADGASSDANALGGSFDSAIANGANSFANAAPGSFDSAIADGANSTADAGGTLGSGLGSFDLAAAFGDMLHAIATGNFMTDIVP